MMLRKHCLTSCKGFLKFKLLVRSSHIEANESADFGFKKVKKSIKSKLVENVFTSVSSSYDIMNDVMSGGIHRIWKDTFIKRMAPQVDTKLIDVAGGTGDIAFRFLDRINEISNTSNIQQLHGFASVTVVDINKSMLEIGQNKFEKFISTKNYDPNISASWVIGDAENLVNFESESFDVYSIAFGIRNCTNIDKVLTEAYRVLRKGGRLMILEFAKVENQLIAPVYEKYLLRVIPHIGHIITGDRDAYQYLSESIIQFPSQEDIVARIQSAGFSIKSKGYENLTGGIAAIWSGWKM